MGRDDWKSGAPAFGLLTWLGSLTTWRLTWVAQGSKYACPREKAGNYSTFYDPALEVTSHPFFCILLVEAVTSLTGIQGKGKGPRDHMPHLAKQFPLISLLVLWPLFWVCRRCWDSS